MQLGMVGLGRMGSNLVFDTDRRQSPHWTTPGPSARSPSGTSRTSSTGREPSGSWCRRRSQEVIGDIADHLDPGDVIIDGGNSYYRDDIDRAEKLTMSGIDHVAVGTSGGVFGRQRGFCLMIGGDDAVIARLDPIFSAVVPGAAAAARSPGRTGEPSPSEQGYLHCGPHGAGHFVKMVHNGIEYGMMAAYAEGMDILAKVGRGADHQELDAETAPLRDPRYYRFNIDVAEVAEVWRRGSVVASWLLDLTAAALAEDPDLGKFHGSVSNSGEGRWTIQAAVELGVPANVLATALFERFSSRGEADYANRFLSAMRKQFGGHDGKSAA